MNDKAELLLDVRDNMHLLKMCQKFGQNRKESIFSQENVPNCAQLFITFLRHDLAGACSHKFQHLLFKDRMLEMLEIDQQVLSLPAVRYSITMYRIMTCVCCNTICVYVFVGFPSDILERINLRPTRIQFTHYLLKGCWYHDQT